MTACGLAHHDPIASQAVNLIWRLVQSRRNRETLSSAKHLDTLAVMQAIVMLDVSERLYPDEVPK